MTAPGVNFKSAAPGSRGSFGCFGIRPDQSTSMTSKGSVKVKKQFIFIPRFRILAIYRKI